MPAPCLGKSRSFHGGSLDFDDDSKLNHSLSSLLHDTGYSDIEKILSETSETQEVSVDDGILAWSPTWENEAEAHLQQHLIDMQAFLRKSSRLHITFDIHNTQTLRSLKPDGHGRLAESSRASNTFHHGFYVEVKTKVTFDAKETRGSSSCSCGDAS